MPSSVSAMQHKMTDLCAGRLINNLQTKIYDLVTTSPSGPFPSYPRARRWIWEGELPVICRLLSPFDLKKKIIVLGSLSPLFSCQIFSPFLIGVLADPKIWD
jgi:hypothetical protein